MVTGLPATPAVATMEAPFLNATPTAIAVSDDGQWAVGVWPAGVYAFGISANIMPLQTDPGVAALAFFHNNHTLAIATAARATSITDVGGANQSSVLYDYSQQALLPKGIGVSFDNQRVLMADAAGKLVNISVASRQRQYRRLRMLAWRGLRPGRRDISLEWNQRPVWNR